MLAEKNWHWEFNLDLDKSWQKKLHSKLNLELSVVIGLHFFMIKKLKNSN